MPQHDLILDNGSGAAFRADANGALEALGTTMKGPNAPPSPRAGMMWLDDDTPSATVWTLKLYDGAEWISVGEFNVTTNSFVSLGAGRAPAGTAVAPAYSFAGDTDTGMFLVAPGTIGVSLNGVRGLEITPNSAILDSVPGAPEASYFARCSDASATNSRATSLLSVNENSTPITGIRQTILTDGSGSIELYATPAGARNADRRVLRGTFPGSGAIGLVGPVNVSSGDLDVAGNLRFNSGYGSAAIAYGVRAWVNFNGTGTVAIRASGGVTSITDNGTGDYTVNFNFTMPDANYCVIGLGASSGPDLLPLGIRGDVPPATTSVRVWVKSVGVAGGAFDPLYASVAIIR